MLSPDVSTALFSPQISEQTPIISAMVLYSG